MEDANNRETPTPENANRVEDHNPPVSADLGYDKGYADGLVAGRKDGHEVGYEAGLAAGREAGLREASEAADVKHAKALEAADAKHEKALEAVEAEHAKELKALMSKHVRALKSARDDEADVTADTARLAAVQEILALLDERIDRGHADGRLAIVDVRNVIATAFEVE